MFWQGLVNSNLYKKPMPAILNDNLPAEEFIFYISYILYFIFIP
jgi:uncharacterized membrane protein